MEGESCAESFAIDLELNKIDTCIKYLSDGLINTSFRHNIKKNRPKVRINSQVSVSNIPPRDYDKNR